MFKRYVLISFLIMGMVFCVNNIAKAENGACPFDREMSLGNENAAVKELQKFLALDKNVYNGPITGYFGPVTQKAVKVFQTKAGLLANGKVDLATATILCQAYLSYKSSMPISNEESSVVDNDCFLETLNLEMGTFKNPNEEVLQLQKWLSINGFYPEKIFTGFFGPLTKKAVQRFQKSVGIIQTGVVGVKTTSAICGGGGGLGDNIKITSTNSQGGVSEFSDLGISFIDINPKQIGVGSKINILVKEKNLSFKTADSHITSFYINDKEKTNKTIPILKSGEEYVSINYDWTCEQKGIYIFKIFIDSANRIIESNKYNNILVFPVNCGGAVQDFKYACNEETQNCEVDISGSMTFGECNSMCKGGGSLPDLYVKDFLPTKIKIKETLPLKIVEGNSGGAKAPRHEYLLTVAFNGENKSQTQVFGEILPKSTQEAGGSWTCVSAGVYTITINLDPKNSIKEMDETNNKKTFKMECADLDGNVPADKSDDSGDEGDNPSEDQDNKSNLPDLKVTMSPTTMVNGGVNRIIVTVTNQGKINIDKQFYIGLEVADANGQRTKIKKDGKDVQVSFAGLAAGATQSVNLFDSTNPSSGQKCDIQNPFEILAIADVTAVISEANENNNIAKSSCGAVKSSTGGSGGSGGGTGGGDDEEETGVPCYSDSVNGASIKYGDVSVNVLGQSYLDGRTEEIATIKYKLQNEKAETASEIVTKLYNPEGLELGDEGVSYILGCKSSSGYFKYKCINKGKITLKIETTYFGKTSNGKTSKTIFKDVVVECQYGSKKADETPDTSPLQYCKINKAISPDDGTVKVSDGEQIKFYLNGITTTSPVIWKWAGGKQFSNVTNDSAYISFSTVGRYMVSGVTATIGENIIPCPTFSPTFTVIVANAGSSSSGGTKYPNLSRDTKCISNLDLNYLNGEICFTNYITDLNNSTTMCPSLEYSWLTKDGVSIDEKKGKTACFPKSQFVNSSTQPGTIETIQAKATCKGNGSYTQTIKCYINAYKEESSGISASCRGTKLSAGKVRFSVTASSSDCSVSNLKYNWDNSTTYTTSQTFDKTYTPNGSQTITSQVKVLCSTNNASATVNCSLNVSDSSGGGGSLPPEDKPVKSDNLSTACTCSGQTCTASMTGKSTESKDYWCTWIINGVTKSGTTKCVYGGVSSISTAKVVLEYNEAYSGWVNEKATATCTVN